MLNQKDLKQIEMVVERATKETDIKIDDLSNVVLAFWKESTEDAREVNMRLDDLRSELREVLGNHENRIRKLEDEAFF